VANVNDFLKAFLMDVIVDGAGIIEKRKLVWLLGRSNARPAVWEELIAQWEDLGMEPDDLQGAEVFGNIVLARAPAKFEPVKKWTVS